MKYIIALYGKSAAGKDTLMNQLSKEFNIQKIVSDTTRPPRDYEEEGKDYFFISEFEFLRRQAGRKYLESRCYHTVQGLWYYGKCKDSIPDDVPVITIFDLQGLKTVAKMGDVVVFPIWVTAPGGERLQRSIERCENPDYFEIYRRIIADEHDFDGHFAEVMGETCKDKYGFHSIIIDTTDGNDLDTCRDYVKSVLKEIEERVNNN